MAGRSIQIWTPIKFRFLVDNRVISGRKTKYFAISFVDSNIEDNHSWKYIYPVRMRRWANPPSNRFPVARNSNLTGLSRKKIKFLTNSLCSSFYTHCSLFSPTELNSSDSSIDSVDKAQSERAVPSNSPLLSKTIAENIKSAAANSLLHFGLFLVGRSCHGYCIITNP